MGGGDQIDVVAADLLQVQHHLSELIIRIVTSMAFYGNRPVLTENASQVAVRKKDRTGSAFSDQRDFFAVMRVRGINYYG